MGLGDDPARSWEEHGRNEAYFGVFSAPRFRAGQLTNDALVEFMASGERHVENMIGLAERHFGPLKRGSVLDFGCGVGRLLVPFAKQFDHAAGIDISESMLREARRNAANAGRTNIAFLRSTDELAPRAGTFDLIHSVLVFQHIPVRQGEALILKLASHLAPGGVAAIHLNLRLNRARWRRVASAARRRVSLLNIPANLINGRPWDEPMFQMNEYSLDRLLPQLGARGFSSILVEQFENAGATQAFLIFSKGK